MLIKLAIGIFILVILYVFILAQIDRRIERKNFNNNIKNFKNGKHKDGGLEDIRKAIHHLHFELDVLTSKTKTGALAPTGVRK